MHSHQLIKLIFVLAAFTVSFDILFVINIGPNLRITQFFFLILICYFLVSSISRKTLKPLGYQPLIIWAFFIISFIPNSGYLPKGLGYGAWLILSIGMIFALVHIIPKIGDLKFFISWYIYSFVFVALFGLIQLSAGILGYGQYLLIKTWWIPGILPRINGFSYEPSFFASYLLIGWVMLSYLIKNKVYIFSSFQMKIFFAIISSALLLSGSRMVLIFIFIWFLQYPLFTFWRLMLLKSYKKDLKTAALGLTLIFITISSINYVIENNNPNNNILFSVTQGIGLGGVSNHSVDTRLGGMKAVIEVFKQSPIIGYSLGGLSSAIGSNTALNVNNFSSAKPRG